MGKSPKQLELLKAPPRFFGGRLLFGRRKSKRPLSKSESVHLVIRSLWARGEHSFRQVWNRSAIERILRVTAKKFGVKIYRQSINSNHLHLILRVQGRKLYAAFVRVITGLIATHVMRGRSFADFQRLVLAQEAKASSKLSVAKAADGLQCQSTGQSMEPQGKGQKFFQFRPFTRVLHWGRDYRTCCGYVLQNTLEAIGFVVFAKRGDRYAKWMRESLADTELIQV